MIIISINGLFEFIVSQITKTLFHITTHILETVYPPACEILPLNGRNAGKKSTAVVPKQTVKAGVKKVTNGQSKKEPVGGGLSF